MEKMYIKVDIGNLKMEEWNDDGYGRSNFIIYFVFQFVWENFQQFYDLKLVLYSRKINFLPPPLFKWVTNRSKW